MYIITNNHVIENGNKFELTFIDGTKANAKLLDGDEYSDIEVLETSVKKGINTVEISTGSIIPGDTAFVIGTPLGSEYSFTVTRGIISGKDRTIEVDDVVTKVIQTDASINPGNSGGPLVNLAGEVIGITSMKLASSEIEGMGFAIPINDAKIYVQSLEKGEEVSRPQLGVSLINVTDTYRLYYYGIRVDNNIKSGVVVADVNIGSPAYNSGITKGDIITKIDDQKIDNISRLRYYLYQHNIGDTVSVTYIRNGKEHTVNVKLEG